jgi:hypothetical protein
MFLYTLNVAKIYATNGRRLEQEQKRKASLAVEDCIKPPKSLRSVTNSFSWKVYCLFCSETAHFDSRHPDRSSNISVVRTLELRDNTLKVALDRHDDWALSVQSRLNTCIDLIHVEGFGAAIPTI